MIFWSFVERVFSVLAVIALAALVALPFLQVVMRDAFNSPIAGLEEATRWGLIGLVFLALPLLVATNEQIRFDELVNRASPRLRRGLERIHLLIAVVILVVLAYAAVGSALKNATSRTPMLNLPFGVFIAPMVIGFGVTAAGALYFALRRSPPPVDAPSSSLFDDDDAAP